MKEGPATQCGEAPFTADLQRWTLHPNAVAEDPSAHPEHQRGAGQNPGKTLCPSVASGGGLAALTIRGRRQDLGLLVCGEIHWATSFIEDHDVPPARRCRGSSGIIGYLRICGLGGLRVRRYRDTWVRGQIPSQLSKGASGFIWPWTFTSATGVESPMA